jgi:hypothetical protein
MIFREVNVRRLCAKRNRRPDRLIRGRYEALKETRVGAANPRIINKIGVAEESAVAGSAGAT